MNILISSILPLFMSALCSALASVIIKYSDKIWLLRAINNDLIIKIPAIGFYGIGFIFYSIGLREMEVSKAYPIMVSFAVVQLVILGYSFGEQISLKMLVGVFFVIVGIIIVNASK